jgi:acetoin utilization deacetylase AcuC-like enzyme
MSVLFVTHPAYLEHRTGQGHPERPQRLEAVRAGAAHAGLGDELVALEPRPASVEDIERVHSPEYVTALERFCRAGGGRLDADTVAGPPSWEAALLAAGAGLDAAARLQAGEAEAAFCAVRPPGHHALETRAMGFCLFNNIAVTAAALAATGDRLFVVDIDAHHGNGTQEMFYADPRVVYVSFHQSPLYPGTGSVLETGEGVAAGTTVNVPLPPGATGDIYRQAINDLVVPLALERPPDWLLISAGFDAHRDDPLTEMGLSAGDYGDITLDLLELVPAGRRILFLEGGYDLNALQACTTTTLAALVGERAHPERPTGGGPGGEIIPLVEVAHRRAVGA